MYSNVYQKGKFLYLRGVEEGRRYKSKLEYRPTVWMASKLKGATEEWRTLDGQMVYAVKPGNIYETREFVDRYSDVNGMTVWESPGNVYQYIAETYPEEIAFSVSDLLITFIDIEVESEKGFPDPRLADERIFLITLRNRGEEKRITWGLKPLTTIIPNQEYRHFPTETALLSDFISYWQNNYPDILSGWNSNLFDVTYLYNRLCKVLGEKFGTKLSPWGQVYQKDVTTKFKQDATKTFIAGVALLDMLDLYIKFGTYSSKESYKLGDVAQDEIGAEKVQMPCATFREFYTDHWDTCVSYNVRDVDLVYWIDEEKGLIDLAITIAYSAKVNFEDVFSPVKCWDNIIYCYLNERRTVIPPRRKNVASTAYEGAYVKDPIVGLHKWAVSFDLTSLYPHIIMQNNMSTETIVDLRYDVTVDRLLNREWQKTDELVEQNLAMAANGCCFKRDNIGLLPVLMERYFELRSVYKKHMLGAKKAKEASPDDVKLKGEISRYDNLQQAMKILLNSMYGALANVYSRYYDIRIAEGITLTGQFVIRSIANSLNEYMNRAMQTENEDYVLLIDTDSVVLNMGGLVDRFCKGKTKEETINFLDKISNEVFQGVINECVEELAVYTNAYAQKMFMKRENIADSMLNVSKKRYVMNVYDSEGVRYNEPKLKIMGLQIVKSSTPAIVRKALKAVIPKILNGSESEVQRFVTEQRAIFKKYSPEQIAFPRGVNNLAKYSDPKTIYDQKSRWVDGSNMSPSAGKMVKVSVPIHVRGALLYNHYVKKHGLQLKYPMIQDGDKIRFLYLKMPNPIMENCIAFNDVLPPEFGLDEYVDYNTMFEKTFQDAVQNFIDPVGWNTEARGSLWDLTD